MGKVKANARRIEACVNACEGVPTESLEKITMREVERQRDDLVAALETLLAEFDPKRAEDPEIGWFHMGMTSEGKEMARAALARARREEP